jgi:hypothetical protein
VRLFTKAGSDWTERYPRISAGRSGVTGGIREATAGPSVAMTPAWRCSKLHSAPMTGNRFYMRPSRARRWIGGHGRSRRAKAQLEKLIAKPPAGIHLGQYGGRWCDHLRPPRKLGSESIVSKHREHPYRSGPSKIRHKIRNRSVRGVLRFRDQT